MPSVLHISNSKRSCAWRDVGFMRDLTKFIRDCPNTQLALWSNRSGDEMRQLIKNTVHSIAHTFGLPLHRIAFAWTGDRSTLQHAIYIRDHHPASTLTPCSRNLALSTSPSLTFGIHHCFSWHVTTPTPVRIPGPADIHCFSDQTASPTCLTGLRFSHTFAHSSANSSYASCRNPQPYAHRLHLLLQRMIKDPATAINSAALNV